MSLPRCPDSLRQQAAIVYYLCMKMISPLWRFVLVLMVCLTVMPAHAERREVEGGVLMVGHCYKPAEARAVLDAMSKTHDDRATWEKRRAAIRKGILEGAGLSPLPEDRKTPKVIRHSKKQLDGYTVENVAIQTLPGFWLCGNLYLPAGYAEAKSKLPGVLTPHGHRQDKRFTEDVQSRSGAFARMGCVVFAYDMVGHGDTTQLKHKHPQALRLQTWNSIRALDFLESLPRIDQDRLAVTGCSGGGTQTFVLSAIDDRVDLSMPVCQVSAHFYGGCVCESGAPVHVRKTHETNNVEFAACFAPKPLLLVSNGKDWTKHTPQDEFPYVQRVYSYYEAKDNVENAHFADEGHDYGPSKRAAAYRFIAKHFKLDLAAVQDDQGKVVESWYRGLNTEDLRVFTADRPRPEGALTAQAEVYAQLDALVADN